MPRTLETTPAADGFHMPGEFERHSGCWMLWPERPDVWRLGGKPAQQAFASVAAAIATSEQVTVGASAKSFKDARNSLPTAVRVVEMSNDDAWMRDIGPTFVTNGTTNRGVDWRFNAWGGKQGGLYKDWSRDDLVADKVLEIELCDRYAAPFVMEGGAIHVDGVGTALTTEECLLNGNRNPELDVGSVEILLHEYLGVSTVIWLEKGVPNDETNGHIDELCCFIKPGVVALTWTDDRRDPLFKICRDAEWRLGEARDARGRKIRIYKLPQPGPLHVTKREANGIEPVRGTLPRRAGDRLPASYVNFYIGNNVVVMSLLDRRYDSTVAKILGELFPRRRVIGVDAREILLGGGGIHCITQQVPGSG